MKTFYFSVKRFMWVNGVVVAATKENAFGIAYIQILKLKGVCTLTIDDLHEVKENKFIIEQTSY